MVDRTPQVAQLDGNRISVDDGNDEAALEAQLLAWDEMQKCKDSVKIEYKDFGQAKKSLERWLKADHPIIYRNPQKKKPDASGNSQETHKPHQTIFLAWAAEVYAKYGGGICTDEMGMGKSHQIISLILLMQRLQRDYYKLGPNSSGPTLVVVPSTLQWDWICRLTNELVGFDKDDEEWQIFIVGDHKQPGYYGQNKKVTLLEDDDAFKNRGSMDHKVFLATYDQLNRLSQKDLDSLSPDFFRIILDEAHAIRHMRENSYGAVFEKLNGTAFHTERWSFTGIPAYNTLDDWVGLLRFHERPHWEDNRNLNKQRVKKYWGVPKVETNPKWSETDQTCEPDEEDEAIDCNCREDQRGRCIHWPAVLKTGRMWDTDGSVEAKYRKRLPPTKAEADSRAAEKKEELDETLDNPKMKKREPKSNRQGPAPKPYDWNPYASYHQKNHNKYKCLTPKAYMYYISTHIPGKIRAGEPDKVYNRMAAILEQLVLYRNPESGYLDENGGKRMIKDDEKEGHLKDMRVVRMSLNQPANVKTEYDRRVKEIVETPTIADLQQEIQQLKVLKASVARAAAPSADVAQLDDVAQSDDGTESDVDDGEPRRRRKTNPFHKFIALCSSQLLHGFRGYTNIWLQERPVCLPLLVQQAEIARRGGDPTVTDNQMFEDDKAVLTRALYGSEVFKAALNDIRNTLAKPTGQRRSVLVFAQLPRTAALFYRILQFMGVKSKLLTAKQKPLERGKTFGEWNRSDGEVLISTYSLNMAGLNGHYNCCSALLLEPAYNVASEQQAYFRIRRWGQTEVQSVIRYHLKESYHDRHALSMYSKIRGISIATGAIHKAAAMAGDQGTKYLAGFFGGKVVEDRDEYVSKGLRRAKEEWKQRGEQHWDDREDEEDAEGAEGE